MKLLEYISDMAQRKQLALSVDSSPDYLWQVATGRRAVSPKLANKIEAATGRAVTRYDLRPDVFGDAPDQQAAA